MHLLAFLPLLMWREAPNTSMLFILAEFLVLKHLQLFGEDSTLGKGNLINILPFWVQFSKVTRLMPFFLYVCQSSYSSTLGQHKPHSSGEVWQRMSCIPTDFATSLVDKQKPRGKNHKASAAQVCLTRWAGLPITVCASQPPSGHPGGTQPVHPQPRTVPAAWAHTGKDRRRTTRNIRDTKSSNYQVKGET